MIVPRNSAIEKLTDEELKTIHQLAIEAKLDQEFINLIPDFLKKRKHRKNANIDS